MIMPIITVENVMTMPARKAVRVPQITPYQMSHWPDEVPMMWTHLSVWNTDCHQKGSGGWRTDQTVPGGTGFGPKPSRGTRYESRALGGGASTGASSAIRPNMAMMAMPVTDMGLVTRPRRMR